MTRHPRIRVRFWKRWLLAVNDTSSFPSAVSQLLAEGAERAAVCFPPLLFQPWSPWSGVLDAIAVVTMGPDFALLLPRAVGLDRCGFEEFYLGILFGMWELDKGKGAFRWKDRADTAVETSLATLCNNQRSSAQL